MERFRLSIVKAEGKQKEITSQPSKAQEKACGQVVIGLSFAHVCLREWREFSKLITERS